jgi:hypothetical protein
MKTLHLMLSRLREETRTFVTTIRSTIGQIQSRPFPQIIIVAGILAAFIGISAAASLPLIWSVLIVLILVALILTALWFKFPTGQRIPPLLARAFWSVVIVGFVVIVLWNPMRTKYLREYPPPSIVYISPGVWLMGPTPEWRMIVDHCGPEPLYNISVAFSDDTRTNAFAGRSSITHQEIIDSETSFRIAEIDPTQAGPAFSWAPLIPEHESYTIRIDARGLVIDQNLRIERVDDKWQYRMTVTDITGGRAAKIINCRDPEFPASPGDAKLPACFPRYTAGEHWGSCI